MIINTCGWVEDLGFKLLLHRSLDPPPRPAASLHPTPPNTHTLTSHLLALAVSKS
jgi:hypothetical protein